MEGSVSAFMATGHPSVDPHRGNVVHGFEVQKESALAELRRMERCLVPEGGVQAGVGNSAGLCLRTEWNLDGSIERNSFRIRIAGRTNAEAPGAVERIPFRSLPLWTRMGPKWRMIHGRLDARRYTKRLADVEKVLWAAGQTIPRFPALREQ